MGCGRTSRAALGVTARRVCTGQRSSRQHGPSAITTASIASGRSRSGSGGLAYRERVRDDQVPAGSQRGQPATKRHAGWRQRVDPEEGSDHAVDQPTTSLTATPATIASTGLTDSTSLVATTLAARTSPDRQVDAARDQNERASAAMISRRLLVEDVQQVCLSEERARDRQHDEEDEEREDDPATAGAAQIGSAARGEWPE